MMMMALSSALFYVRYCQVASKHDDDERGGRAGRENISEWRWNVSESQFRDRNIRHYYKRHIKWSQRKQWCESELNKLATLDILITNGRLSAVYHSVFNGPNDALNNKHFKLFSLSTHNKNTFQLIVQTRTNRVNECQIKFNNDAERRPHVDNCVQSASTSAEGGIDALWVGSRAIWILKTSRRFHRAADVRC